MSFMSQTEVRRKQIQAFSGMIGIVMLFVMGKKIGCNGIAYLAAAVECLALACALLSRDVPDVLGRMLRSRRSKEQYRNAGKLQSSVFAVQLLLGVLCAGALVVLADLLAEKVFRMPYSALAIRLLAPVLLLRVLGSVFLGMIQGGGNQMPTAVSSVLRQILILVFGLIFVPVTQRYGEKVSALLLNEDMPSMYGAIGLSAAMLMAEILIFVFLIMVSLGNRSARKAERGEGLKRTETFAGALRSFYLGAGVLFLMQFLLRFPVFLGMILLGKNVAEGSSWILELGVFYGGYLALYALPGLLAGSFLLPVAARVVAATRKTEPRYARDICGMGVHLGLVYTLYPAAFGIAMAGQLGILFGGEQGETLSKLLQAGALGVVLIVLSWFFLKVLVNIGNTLVALGAAGAFVIVFCLCGNLFTGALALGSLGLVYAGVLAGLALCALSGVSLFLTLRFRLDYIRWIGIPLGCALLSGLVCLLLGRVLTVPLGEAGTVILCLLLGLVVYLAPQLVSGSFREPEFRLIPGGAFLRKLAGKR